MEKKTRKESDLSILAKESMNRVKNIFISQNHNIKKILICLFFIIIIFVIGTQIYYYRQKQIYLYAKPIYEDLNNCVEICSEIMDKEYDAWYYWVWNHETANVSGLANATTINQYEIEDALTSLGQKYKTYQEGYIKKGFENCTKTIVKVYDNRGKINEIERKLNKIDSKLKELNEKYPQYKYYSHFKTYYEDLCSYYKFVKSPTGSLSELRDTINKYEDKLKLDKSCIKNID